MEKVYGVALIGCGQMGAVHLENIYYKEKAGMENENYQAQRFGSEF